MLTQDRLRQVLKYDPETGDFFWLEPQSNRVSKGDKAGSFFNGYFHIGIDGVRHRAHRLAWMYVHGEMPVALIDHINRNGADNRISNLRAADRLLNARNRGAGKNNSSGVRGVHYSSHTKKWRAVITVEYKNVHLGLFNSLEDARMARLAAEKDYWQCAF